MCVGLGVNGPRAADNADINRGAFEPTGQSYHICRDVPNGPGMTYAYDNLPSKSKTVRLGIRRQGKEAILLAADGPAEPLADVRRYRFTDQPVSSLAVYTTTGGSDLPLTLKVSDVKLYTAAVLPAAPAKAKMPSVVMVPPHDPVQPTTRAVPLPLDDATASASARCGAGVGEMPVASGLAELVAGLLAGRWWGGRTGGDE